MKLTKTEFNLEINNSSSWIVYITKTREEARALYSFAMSQRSVLTALDGWHYSVQCKDVMQDCRVPEFFHDHGYHMTVVEHNNGDWNSPAKYELYIVD